MSKAVRAALYLRVSTDDQTTENQALVLREVAAQRGWSIVATFEDAGVSGSKGRDKRPGLDALLNDATRGRFDVVMVWALDRLGRSLQDLLGTLGVLKEAGVDLFLHQQAIDTSTPTGRMFFQFLGAFAEFEREMIVARVKAGQARARAAGKRIGGRPSDPAKEARLRALLLGGMGLVRAARTVGCGTSLAQRLKREMDAAA